MWRFILVTFAFLGWSFYELSGGADYKPGAQSLQAHMKLGATRPEARSEPVQTAEAASEADAEDVTRSVTTLTDLSVDGTERVQVVLASASSGEGVLSEAEADETRTKAEILTESEAADEAATAEEDRIAALTVEEFVATSLAQSAAPDIRWVDRDVVNMRDGPGTQFNRVARLTRGTEVSILEATGDGWVMLEVTETGETGWMADWLLREPN